MRLSKRALQTLLFISSIAVTLVVSADSQNPSAVTQIRASGESGPAIAISWSEPSDNIGVEGYNIYRDGNYYKTVFGTTRYTDRNVNAGYGYNYYVVAFDYDRNYGIKGVDITAVAGGDSSSEDVSPPSSGGSSDTPQQSSNDKPAPPGNVKIDSVSNSSITLSWSTPSGGAEGFNIYIDGRYFETVRGTNTYTANSLTSGREYSFSVVAFRNNLFSVSSSRVTATVGNESNGSPPPQNDPVSGGGNSDSAVPDNYELVFSDDFNNGSINPSKWNTRYRWGSDLIINNEEQYYVDSLLNPDFGVTPFKLNNGILTIQASRTPDWLRSSARGQRYLSGAMTTFNKFRMTYGYVEMRAKLPRGAGLWPAFWLLHQSDFRDRPEIDVVEMLGQNPRLVYQTYHYYNNSNLVSTPSFQAPGPNYANDFHTFGMLWERGRIIWYVDGVETNRYESNRVSSESMYLLMNLALGGGWAGSPNGSTQFPAKFEIDYVRAYQAR